MFKSQQNFNKDHSQSDDKGSKSDERSDNDFDPTDPNQLLRAFNPLPSEYVQKKIDFFFMPYAP